MSINNDILLINVIYYSLFQKKIFENENEIINYFPENVFGIFSTIRRAHKIKTYPIDIHGCIGYWDKNFNTLKKQILYKHLLQVAHDSVWKDDRNKYFTPIESEPETFIELDFMLNPIYKINKKDGTIIELNISFTNNIFGIIIQSKDKTNTATYLPNVFPNISWKNILKSLKNKSNIISDEYELFAYKIIQKKTKFINILTNKNYNYNCIFNFSRLLIDNMSKGMIPYSCKNNKLEWNSKDDVRNISVLADVFKYINLYPYIASKSEIDKLKNKILDILQKIELYSSQSLSFLGYIYKIPQAKNKYINPKPFCEKLLKDLPNAENEFEKPEIIIGLNKAGCIMNINDFLLTYNSNDSIFKMNWIIQAIISFNKKPSNQLIIILENKIKDIIKNKKLIETNYLAVAFEALCFIYQSNRKVSLLNQLFQLFFELEQRKKYYNVLYIFLQGSARVDITGHIMNGLNELYRV